MKLFMIELTAVAIYSGLNIDGLVALAIRNW